MPKRIARAIECTRFPAFTPTKEEEPDEEGQLVRAADLIGQLGDPHYLRKAIRIVERKSNVHNLKTAGSGCCIL